MSLVNYQKLHPKPAMVKSETPDSPKSKAHRRSRSGCFTCRLRRKKCDESKPSCKACNKLGVDCEYALPAWWTNPDRRRKHRDHIKNIIKITKMNDRQPPGHKMASSVSTIPTTPPSLYQAILPSSESNMDAFGSSRTASLDSAYMQFGMGAPQSHNLQPVMHHQPHFPPYYSQRTDPEIFIDDLSLANDSTNAAFTAAYQPEALESLSQFSTDALAQHGFFEQQHDFFTDEPLPFNIFDFAHEPLDPTHQTVIDVEDADMHLLDHFLNHVTQHIFPFLEMSQPGAKWTDVILPAMESNKNYLHGCLSVAALHIKATERIESQMLNNDAMRHRIAAVAGLCQSFRVGTDTSKILEATLALIFFQSALGSPTDGLPDISWRQHFSAALDIISTLQFQQLEAAQTQIRPQLSFQMTVATWIDILGGTMLGRPSVFAQIYSHKREQNIPSGLAELMGCNDGVMYLISEISCLEALRDQGFTTDETICTHITDIGNMLAFSEMGYGEVVSVYHEGTGSINPDQLACNITAIFRMAARLYLCSLVPDFEPHQENVMLLLDSFVNTMAFIPAGPDGFDRSLVWPLLMAGSISVEGSSFRSMFADRAALLGTEVEFGAFARLKEIFDDIWAINDAAVNAIAAGDMDAKIVHWRDAMKHKGWEFLLM